MLRGWGFDSSGREGAVLKGWVESRFGLAVQYHQGNFAFDRCKGLYGTNALESQLDLVYTYCQYELALSHSQQSHLTLYRGVNALDEYRVLERDGKRAVVLMNNVSSFTHSRERADEFGDYVIEARVPLVKVLAYYDLLPKLLRGEGEFLVVGGVYKLRSRRVGGAKRYPPSSPFTPFITLNEWYREDGGYRVPLHPPYVCASR